MSNKDKEPPVARESDWGASWLEDEADSPAFLSTASERNRQRARDVTSHIEGTNDAEKQAVSTGKGRFRNAWEFLRDGGTVFDGFLLAASKEVGQSLLTIPYVFALTGIPIGIVLELTFASLALYTNYILVSLHTQYRKQLKDTDDPRSKDPNHIVSYHEIVGEMTGSNFFKYFSLCTVFFSLLGLSTVQIIATSSNLYLLNDNYNKRTYSIVFGFLFTVVAFIPNFRHYRTFSFIGLLATTYTAWFMTIASMTTTPAPQTKHSAPTSVEGLLDGLVTLLFVYGGHTSNIEVADVMDAPDSYDNSYFYSYLYVFTLTMPNAVTTYRTFGDSCMENSNAFAYFGASHARDLGIVLMTLHQCVAFGLFVGPLFHMWEKLLGITHKNFSVKVVARLPLLAVIVVIAVMIPFFGAINGVLGAFTTSLGTYIIPLIAYNMAFSPKKEKALVEQYQKKMQSEHEHITLEEIMTKKPPLGSLGLTRLINWALATFVIVFGLIAGGFYSIKNFAAQVEEFKLFAECYQCDEFSTSAGDL